MGEAKRRGSLDDRIHQSQESERQRQQAAEEKRRADAQARQEYLDSLPLEQRTRVLQQEQEEAARIRRAKLTLATMIGIAAGASMPVRRSLDEANKLFPDEGQL